MNNTDTGKLMKGNERDKVKVSRLRDVAQALAIHIPASSYPVTKRK